MTGSVTVCGNRPYSTFERVARLEEMQALFVGLRNTFCQLGMVAIHSLPDGDKDTNLS